MKIGRLVGSTLSDWKGRNSCKLEVRGSVTRCPCFCSPDIFEENGPCIEEEEILAYIDEHRDTLESVVIGGGEPLLQKDLYPFLKKLKPFKLPVMLETEGTEPDTLDDLVGAMMFGYVRITIPGIVPPEHADSVKRSLGILADSGMDYEVAVAAVPGTVSCGSVQEVAKTIGKKGTLLLFKCNAPKTDDPAQAKPLKNKEVLELVAAAKKFTKKVELRGF